MGMAGSGCAAGRSSIIHNGCPLNQAEWIRKIRHPMSILIVEDNALSADPQEGGY